MKISKMARRPNNGELLLRRDIFAVFPAPIEAVNLGGSTTDWRTAFCASFHPPARAKGVRAPRCLKLHHRVVP